MGPEVDVCLHSRSKGTWKCHSKESRWSECVYKVVHLWEEKGGDTPCPSRKTPDKQTLLCSRPPLWTLRGDEHSGTEPPSFGHGEQKVPVGLKQAVLPGLPQAFQSGGILNSCGLWCCAATSTLDPVRALGGDSSLELEGAKGRAQGAQPGVDGYRMCCPSLSSPSQGYKLLQPEEPNHHLLLLQVAEGTEELLRGRQPICKYPVSFPAYYAM